MGIRNTAGGWGWLARAFHWVMAVLIVGSLGVGFYMVEVVGDDLIQRFELTQLHKSFGFVIFCLAVARVVWRLANPTPTLAGLPAWQRAASHVSHFGLYALILAMPITGWLMATSSPLNDPDAYPMQVKNMVFGLFALPDPYPEGDKALSETFAAIHFWLAITLSALLAVHVAAALKHHLIDKDNVLRRMVTGR